MHMSLTFHSKMLMNFVALLAPVALAVPQFTMSSFTTSVARISGSASFISTDYWAIVGSNSYKVGDGTTGSITKQLNSNGTYTFTFSGATSGYLDFTMVSHWILDGANSYVWLGTTSNGVQTQFKKSTHTKGSYGTNTVSVAVTNGQAVTLVMQIVNLNSLSKFAMVDGLKVVAR
jgi:hypothetical protein